jgi:hypothetical protein
MNGHTDWSTAATDYPNLKDSSAVALEYELLRRPP